MVLLLVADGMGRHEAGDVASQMAVEIVSAELLSDLPHCSTRPNCNGRLPHRLKKQC